MSNKYKSMLVEIETAEADYRNKSEKYSKLSMWLLLPMFIGNIIMSFQIDIGFIIWIISMLGSIYYCYLSNKYLNKFRKEMDRIFKKYRNKEF